MAFYYFLKNLDSISADVKLETETEDGFFSEDAPNFLSKKIYHPRFALKNAILDWLPEFFEKKDHVGPLVKPHPPVTSKFFFNHRNTNITFNRQSRPINYILMHIDYFLR